MRWLLAGLLVITAAGCGSSTKTALQLDPTPPLTIAATPIPTASPSPTTTQTVIYETSSGLACYTDKVAHNLYGHGFASEDEIEGFPTLEEAVSDWWDDRPDVFRNEERPLTQSPVDGSMVAFRDEHGNAQLILYGEQASNGVWNIASAEFCSTPPNYIPR